MNQKMLHRIYAGVVFAASVLVYLLTVQPNVSFWDCGEFIASSFLMQVPHPPGTPFFLMLGRMFSLIPFGDNVAFNVNMISVLSSGFTVMFLYLTAVHLINSLNGNKKETLGESIGTYTAAAIGAFSLAFSDTFWFNASEAEVYALATFFIAFVVWMMVVWNAKADNHDSEKYLLLIAYVIGLSTGVHLMSVLVIVPIIMLIMFRKFITDEVILKKTAILFVIHSAIILVIAIGMWASQTDSNPPGSEVFKAFDKKMLLILVAVSAIFVGILWRKIFQKNSFYLPIIFGGLALVITYPGLVKYFPKYLFSIGGDSVTLNIFVILCVFAALGYLMYWASKNRKETFNLIGKAFLFALIGYTTYAMIIIRANQDPPINLNSPKTSSEVMSYLNREQYGDFPTLKRRYTQEAHQTTVYKDYSSDLDFLWTYQMNHMFNRYLLWNFVGRSSTVQDSGVDWGQLFGIPFFLGLLGLYYQFKKDWKMGAVFLVMFIFLGWLTAFYQNQQQPQPRERDYFYVGAFFVFSIWIALGVKGLLELIRDSIKDRKTSKIVQYAVLALAIFAVPINMLSTNYWTHDRARNFVPWDYSYNLLQSVAPNAILYTNGDNDTFPLWYLQDVEGVRQDVRIANLSLLNTPWYIKQMKNTAPHGALKIAMTMRDKDIAGIRPIQFDPKKFYLPVTPEQFAQFGVTDTAIINKGRIDWTMPNTMQFGDIKAVRAQDLCVLSMVQANKFDRPIYFAVTVSDDSRIGLDEHLKMEGLAFRLVPEKHDPRRTTALDVELMRTNLMEEPEGYSKDYQPGFKFRGINDSTIYFDSNHSRLIQNYRNSFIRLANHYYYELNDNKNAIEVLNTMETKLPRNHIAIDYRILFNISSLYFDAGDIEKGRETALDVEKSALRVIEKNPRQLQPGMYNPYQMLINIYERYNEYDKAIDLLTKLQKVMPNDASLKRRIEQYQRVSNENKPEVIDETIAIDSTTK